MRWGRLLFGFRGRINRAKFWRETLIYCVVFLLLNVAEALRQFDDQAVLPAGNGTVVVFARRASEAPSVNSGIEAIPLVIGIATWSVTIVLFVSALAVGIKRLHDQDRSGWWMVLLLGAPIVFVNVGFVGLLIGVSIDGFHQSRIVALVIAVWAVIELGCFPGTNGPNRYGPRSR